jgi:hypothetical protein
VSVGRRRHNITAAASDLMDFGGGSGLEEGQGEDNGGGE